MRYCAACLSKDCVPQMFGKALVILPYLSVVAEKTEHLTSVLREMKCKVKGYMGTDESGTPLSPRSVKLLLCQPAKVPICICICLFSACTLVSLLCLPVCLPDMLLSVHSTYVSLLLVEDYKQAARWLYAKKVDWQLLQLLV